MSKDTIYREDAIKTLTENVMFEFTEDEEWAITCLKNLPSAGRPSDPHDITYINALKNRIKELEADRPQGEWIVNIFDYKSVCSVCGANETDFIYGTEMWYGLGKSKFCPSCGARLKGADDERS